MMTMDQIERGFAEVRGLIKALGDAVAAGFAQAKTDLAQVKTDLAQVKTDLRVEFGSMLEAERDHYGGLVDEQNELGKNLARLKRGQDALAESVALIRMDVIIVKSKVERVYQHLKLNGKRKPRSKR